MKSLLGTKTQLLASATLLTLGIATPAAAQTQPPSPPANESVSDENSEAIIVTAQKREEVLLEVPQSVTVVGGDTLDRQQATNFQDYLALVPGLSLEGSTPGVTRVTLRGVNTGGVASTVAIYMDEVPFGSSTGLANGAILSGDFDPFDISRIEVLRGPQGTLYGASSLGGVIKYVTNPPRLNRFEAKAQVGLESTKGSGSLGYNAAGIINVPLGQKVALRVDGFLRKDQGYIDSIGNNPILSILTGEEIGRTRIKKDINTRKTYGGRASLLFQATEDLSVRLTGFAQNLNSGGSGAFEVDPITLKPLYGGLVQSNYQPEPTKIKYRVYSGTLDWDLGFANLMSSTSYSTFKENLETDASFVDVGGGLGFAQLVNALANLGSAAPDVIGLPAITDTPITRPLGVELFQTTGTNKFTQELRLSSPNNDALEWLIGAFYTHEKSVIDPQNYFATEFGTDTIATDVAQIADIFLHSRYEEYAAFANATWHITPRFDLTGGGRLSHNKQSADLRITSDLLGNSEGKDLNSSESVFTYSVAPRFELNDHTSLYARVASGYRPGGPNVIPIGSPADTPRIYDADRLTSYEVGVKAETPGRKFSFEAALFHLDWKDIQLFAIVNNTGINENGGKARINGVEFSSAWRPVRGLTIAANGAYTNSKLKDDTPAATGGLTGDPLPYVPKWSGALNADYEFPIGASTAFVGGTLARTGKRAVNLNERRADGDVVMIPGYTEVDLRAGANVGRFTVQAFARNLFNKRGITSAFGFSPGNFPNNAAGVAIIRPRTIGLTLTAGF